MRITIQPIVEPHREIDITHLLVSAIAEELYRRYRGNALLNWIEAESHLARILAQVRATDGEQDPTVSMTPREAVGSGHQSREGAIEKKACEQPGRRPTEHAIRKLIQSRRNNGNWSAAPNEERRNGRSMQGSAQNQKDPNHLFMQGIRKSNGRDRS